MSVEEVSVEESYPVRVRGAVEENVSRGLWLVKWLLLIPHAVLLGFLWVAFVVLSVVALVAILVTGRYPHSVFDFNVGVLRWSWRVWFYGYGALGTDRYPPFTLHDVPDYPAGLEIDRPERLSRGLVLVKTWLLAVPHYLVIAFFAGSGVTLAADEQDRVWSWGGGLIVLLTLFGAVALLASGRRPRTISDFVLGMDRWVLRVLAYAALMTDRYPPFRLDQGGTEPAGSADGAPEVPVAPVAGARHERPVGWTGWRIFSVTAGSVLTVLAILLGIGGSALFAVDHGLRDRDGYLMSGRELVASDGFAVTTEDLDLQIDAGTGAMPRRLIGTVKITADGGPGAPVFVGVARSTDVEAYLSGVGHSVITDVGGGPRRHHIDYREVAGSLAPAEPGAQDFWDEQVAGTGRQELLWEPRAGEWTFVLMNVDAQQGVRATMTAGATVPVLGWGAGGLFGGAALLLLAGSVGIAWAVRAAHRTTAQGLG